MKRTQEFLERLKNSNFDESKHLPLLPIGRTISSEAKKKSTQVPIKTAIGVHLFQNEFNQLNTLLIQRSIYEGKHSGQIGFPGGKMDSGDQDLEYTARRESYEEVGIQMNHGTFITQLTPVFIPVSNFEMFPFVFYHDCKIELHLNQREVQSVVALNISDLSERIPIINRDVPFENNSLFLRNVPGFLIEDHWVWGATALVLNELKLIYQEP